MDIKETQSVLTGLLDDLGAERRVMIGNSMGGFGAMLFGWTMGIDHILAFAPQTSVALAQSLAWGDVRWWRQKSRMYWRYGLSSGHYDLLKLAHDLQASAPKPLPQTEIFLGATSRLDMRHAQHLASLPNVDIHPVSGHGHNAVKALRDNGSLSAVLTRAFAP